MPPRKSSTTRKRTTARRPQAKRRVATATRKPKSFASKLASWTKL